MMDALSLFTVFLGFGNILVMFFPLLNDKIIIEFVWPDFYSNAYFYIALLGFSLSLCYRYIDIAILATSSNYESSGNSTLKCSPLKFPRSEFIKPTWNRNRHSGRTMRIIILF
jgi:hypothetical protein